MHLYGLVGNYLPFCCLFRFIAMQSQWMGRAFFSICFCELRVEKYSGSGRTMT